MVVQFFIQMISPKQDIKLKRTVKKLAISLIYQFLFSISQGDISLFCNLSGILDEGVDTLKCK